VNLTRFNHVNINCLDMDRQLPFYRDVLGCEVVVSGGTEESGAVFETMGFPGQRGARTEVLAVGGRTRGPYIELIQWTEVGSDKVADPRDIGMARIGFLVDDVVAAADDLAGQGIELLTDVHSGGVGPARVKAVFFRDPEGNLLELLEHDTGS